METNNELPKRFIITRALSGIIFIKDTKDDSLVAAVHKSKRPQDHTEAMAKTMLDALNRAVERKNGIQ